MAGLDGHLDKEDVSPSGQWKNFLMKTFATAQLASVAGHRLKYVRSDDQAYPLGEFIAQVDVFLKGVRRYLIQLNDQRRLDSFEKRVNVAVDQLTQTLSRQPIAERAEFTATVLSETLQDIDCEWLIRRRLCKSQLQLDALARAVNRLANLESKTINSVPDTASAVIPASSAQVRTTKAAPVVAPYRSPVPSTPPPVASRSWRLNRYALVCVLGGLGVAAIAASDERDGAQSTAVVSRPDPYLGSHSNPRSDTLNREAQFIRHTGIIIDPKKPHESLVIPTLTHFFARYPTQLSRCFTDSTLGVTSAEDLAHYIAENRIQDAHNLIQAVARRRRNRTFTIWWTENCHEIVVAAGEQIRFTGYLNPKPVTIVLPVGPQR